MINFNDEYDYKLDVYISYCDINQKIIVEHMGKKILVKIPQKIEIEKNILLRLNGLGKTFNEKAGDLYLNVYLNENIENEKNIYDEYEKNTDSYIQKLKDDINYHVILIDEAEESFDYRKIVYISYFLYMSGNFTAGIRYYKKACELKNEEPQTEMMQLNMGQLSEEIKSDFGFFDKISTYSPQEIIEKLLTYEEKYKCSAVVFSSIGCSYSIIGDLEKAKKYLDKAMLLDPYFPDVISNYAVLLVKLEKKHEAIELLKKGIQKHPDFKMFKRNLDVLQTGKSKIQYLIIITSDKDIDINEIQDIVINNYSSEIEDKKTVLSPITNSIDIIKKMQSDIEKYGNNLYTDNFLKDENGIKHGKAWAEVSIYAHEKNIDLKNREILIDYIVKNRKIYIIIKIY